MEMGDTCVRREVWRGHPWMALATNVIEDCPDLLAIHVPLGAPFGFVDEHPLGIHPWRAASAWSGQDIVMVQRPGEAYSIWCFGDVVYVNLQDPLRRSAIGFDTFDHELDIIVLPDGTWSFKDDQKLEHSVDLGRFDSKQITAIRQQGALIGALIGSGHAWWTELDTDYRTWSAPSSFPIPVLPAGWQVTS
jgi:Protein of unknown function (DUF402)